jgi:membrane fusion protein (multidrug efflux system)
MIKKWMAIGAVTAIISCGDSKPPAPLQGPPPAVPVTTAVVNSANAKYYDEYPGTLAALNQVDLRAQVNGYITGIFFREGERVKKGQRLYSIDQQQYEANYQQAVANLQVHEANLVRAKKDADRYHELDKQDAVAKQLVDNADATLAAAEKQVEAAKATVRSVQTGVRYTNISAPFDGTIGISQVKMGSPVSAGQTILNTISSDNPVTVDFPVDQREIFRFTQLQQKNLAASDSTFTLAFGTDIYPNPGKILLIDRAVDPQTSSIKVRLVFQNPKGMLKPGMSGKVRVLNSTEAVVIPYKAVTEQLGEFYVYVVGDSSKVSQKKVQVGKALGTNVIIHDGLKDGDEIVVQGVQNLREGAVVKPA